MPTLRRSSFTGNDLEENNPDQINPEQIPGLSLSGTQEQKFSIESYTGFSTSYNTEESLQNLWEIGVIILNPQEIRSYLSKHSELSEILYLVGGLVKNYFSPKGQILLSYYFDLEAEDEYLFLEVRMDSYPENIMDQIRLVSKKCQSLLEKCSGFLLISTDFKFPIQNEL